MPEHNTTAVGASGRGSCFCNHCRQSFSRRDLDAHFLCTTCRAIPGVRGEQPARVAPNEGRPSLLDQLRRDGFELVPTYDRPLDGRIVGQRMVDPTGKMRDVTDYELVGRICGGGEELGRLIRQTWYFRVDGVRLRVNEFWNTWWHYGLQYCTSVCWGCGKERWINADRPPSPRCRACRSALFHGTPRCPELGRACSTAYKRHGCRCEVCRDWNTAKHRRLRAARRAQPAPRSVTPLLVQREEEQEQEQKVLLSPQSSSLCTNKGVTTDGEPTDDDGDDAADVVVCWQEWPEWPSGWWTWLPESVRSSLARYEAALDRAVLGEEEPDAPVAATVGT